MPTDVETLIFDTALGYPQKQQVIIDGVAYTLFFRWNPEDEGFAVVKICRNTDDAVVLNTRIDNLTPVVAKDPLTKITAFEVFPYSITAKTCTLWVFHD